eukprot:Amastigsp_a187_12.p3 type:complete len:107 gc:universal Amastigsp_a187_12:481-161(-)
MRRSSSPILRRPPRSPTAFASRGSSGLWRRRTTSPKPSSIFSRRVPRTPAPCCSLTTTRTTSSKSSCTLPTLRATASRTTSACTAFGSLRRRVAKTKTTVQTSEQS